jgi:hypothetical protein
MMTVMMMTTMKRMMIVVVVEKVLNIAVFLNVMPRSVV